MKLSLHALSSATDSICAMLNCGHLRMFNAAGVLLAELKFANPAFKQSIDGLAQSYPLISETNAPASGCATVFHACDPSGLPIFTGTIGDSDDCDMIMDSPHIAAGATIDVDSFTFSFPVR